MTGVGLGAGAGVVIFFAVAGLPLARNGALGRLRSRARPRLGRRGRIVALGLVGSALTCMAGTITAALMEGAGTVAWRAVLWMLFWSYCAASAVVAVAFPWLMPRLTAWLERNAADPD